MLWKTISLRRGSPVLRPVVVMSMTAPSASAARTSSFIGPSCPARRPTSDGPAYQRPEAVADRVPCERRPRPRTGCGRPLQRGARSARGQGPQGAPQAVEVGRTEDDPGLGGQVEQVEVDAGGGDGAGQVGEH